MIHFKIIIVMLWTVLCIVSPLFGGTIDPSLSDSKYINFGKQFNCVVKICGKYKDGTLFCASAVVIDKHHILTAAHVVKNYERCYVTIEDKKFELSDIVVHKDFENGGFGIADIAIGYSKQDFELDEYPPIYEGDDEQDKICSISGYGFTGNFVTGAKIFDNKKRAGSNRIDYINKDLLPTEFTNLFLNYNRKPHGHRIGLVTELEKKNLLKHGIVTLGEKYTIEETNNYTEYGSADVVDNIGIPNDIYSLGRLDIWQRHFLNIVSETEFTPTSYFLSEKTFKPIIGLRPFIINGNPKIYSWLLDAGFDCFEDIFPINKLQQQTNTNHTHRLITSLLKDLLNSDLNSLYQKIYPRCLYNQTHFYNLRKIKYYVNLILKMFY